MRMTERRVRQAANPGVDQMLARCALDILAVLEQVVTFTARAATHPTAETSHNNITG